MSDATNAEKLAAIAQGAHPTHIALLVDLDHFQKSRRTFAPLYKETCIASKQVKAWKALDWETFDDAEPWSAELMSVVA